MAVPKKEKGTVNSTHISENSVKNQGKYTKFPRVKKPNILQLINNFEKTLLERSVYLTDYSAVKNNDSDLIRIRHLKNVIERCPNTQMSIVQNKIRNTFISSEERGVDISYKDICTEFNMKGMFDIKYFKPNIYVR